MLFYEHQRHYLDDDFVNGKEVDQWFLMSSPWPVLSIVAFYLLFVTKLGPDLMKDRNPFNIKPVILIYNLYQTIFNAYIVSLLFITEGALNYTWNHACHPIDPSINPFVSTLNSASWLYFFSKVVDLLDTVFFILRKKQSHVTFLHVYHHTNMVLSTWAYLKYIRGTEMQKYLRWINYITWLQMFQFKILILMCMAGLYFSHFKPHKVSHLLTIFIIVQGTRLLALFVKFYVYIYRMRNLENHLDRVIAEMNGMFTDDSALSIQADTDTVANKKKD